MSEVGFRVGDMPPMVEVRGLGTTWYRRGFAYWRKRTFVAFFMVLGLACTTWFAVTIFVVVAQKTGSWARIICLTVLALGFLWSVIAGLLALGRRRSAIVSGAPIDIGDAFRLALGRQPTTGTDRSPSVVSTSGSVVARLLYPFASVFVVGWMLALVVVSFGRYLNADEMIAVNNALRWFQQHPEFPNDQRPKQFRR
ncbi:hypothetical protein KHQ06_30200 [Nocardia tengchongensis]|uniref:Uncharacterized protein n=1 Tax=Nocardia tengchongensis TaxID=2055889 RepID=A0ABX8CKC3_9NOCA|nr:hypothetical protein [Nocardia tengchongensis]QVI20406.1 hypothetical protein KHQ06_30200 [Nocardia tengchongensis]